MPLYVFKTEDGEAVEVNMAIADYDTRVTNGRIRLEDGRAARRVYAPVAVESEWSKPIHSTAMAVHPKDIAESVRKCERRGVPTEFDRTGRPVLTSREHRRRFMKAFHFQDLDGGYSDA